ncbi:dCTP deaminase/dUTPase family protein [Lapidilactobacillus wuchangensis]|uniref:dUTP diphosphatase n=1 Tax=Lapidilactobacillus wuchangensis TaxID=2486001 RepID=UPI000F78A7D8|nr:dUTP diphosphatase [Lapidilactobacillus wuchangensis]
MGVRGFEIVSRFKGQEVALPERHTKHAAGYDFAAAEDFVLPSIWKMNFVKVFRKINNEHELMNKDYLRAEATLRPLLVPTGIKAKMADDEVLLLVNRSSSPLKRFLILPNGVGVIDSDYYNNKTNEGEIFFQLVNYGLRDQVIKKGDRLGQGIFVKYLTTDDEAPITQERQGGFGSSGR